MRKVNSMLDDPNFSEQDIKSTSESLSSIIKWVKAMMKYHALLKIVNPKRAKVAEMNEALAIVTARLKEKMKQL